MDIEEQEYVIKPMNCLGHILIYKTELHSYRELPIRYAELGTVYRYERSGVLHGLSRVRGFTQDDAHIFCRFEQLEQDIDNFIKSNHLDGLVDINNFPKLNSTEHSDYCRYYSDKSKSIVEKMWGDDLDCFSYSFEEGR